MKSYDQIFTLEVNKTKEEIIQILEGQGKVSVSEKSISLNHKPSWYNFFSGRGTVTIIPDKSNAAKTSMQCVLHPAMADIRTTSVFLLWNIPLWLALIWFFPWNIILIAVFFIEWLMMAFIAIPVLFLTTLVVSCYLLLTSFTWQSAFFIVVAWSFFYLLLNAALRYNRGELKRWLVRLFL